ncbi:hypothetical protein PT974_12497 [Cladobotryum mycophilum]|uniref:Uncharacterized protein n=1 Tax=Cladobotryum mycophilum TaxID=491253 RepID=A0ABR0S843_9HYPO
MVIDSDEPRYHFSDNGQSTRRVNIVANAQPFGGGPGATLRAIVPFLRDRLKSWGPVTLHYVGSNITMELQTLRKGRDCIYWDKLHDVDVSSHRGKAQLESLLGHLQPRLVVTAMDEDFAATARQAGCRVVIIDLLLWWWPGKIPDPWREAERIMAADFYGVRERVVREKLTNVVTLPPIGPPIRTNRLSPRKDVLLNFGGLLNPLMSKEECIEYAQMIYRLARRALKLRNAALPEADSAELMVLVASSDVARAIDAENPQVARMVLPHEALDLMATAQLVCCTPGLGNLYAAAAVAETVLLLPPLHETHGLQIALVQEAGVGVDAVEWHDLIGGSRMNYDRPGPEVVADVSRARRRVIASLEMQEIMVNRMLMAMNAAARGLDGEPPLRTLITTFGQDNGDQMAAEIIIGVKARRQKWTNLRHVLWSKNFIAISRGSTRSTHASIESRWRSFQKGQREKCVKAGVAGGVMLKHSSDASLGNVFKITPEWNLRDIAESGSDFLLDLLEHRATKPLFEQYGEGFNGRKGDRDFILEMVRTKNLRHVNSFRDSYTLFVNDDEQYGFSYEIVSENASMEAYFKSLMQRGYCVPQSTGELILQRQATLLQSLNILVEDILDLGSPTMIRMRRPQKSDKAATEALSKLSIQNQSTKLALPDLLATAHDQSESLQEYLGFLSVEPVVLSHSVNIFFFSRPELIADEKGRQLAVHTDKYISGAFFDAVHSAIKAAAIWNYINRLLQLLETLKTDKVYRAIVLQEISNVCHLEYGRAQALFMRHVQTGTGSKWFKRLSNKYDNLGNAKVAMKGKPDELTIADPQLHYVLRLCQSDTNATKAADWMGKLGGLHTAHPTEREKLEGREVEALCDLAVIIGFIRDLSPLISMPSLSRKKGQMFVARSQELEAELNQLKSQVDLRDWVVPIDNLLEPGVASTALGALDQFVAEKAGSKIGFLYQDLVEECFSDLQNQYEQVKTKLEQKAEWTPLPVPPLEPLEKRIEQRKQKEKTRPSHSSAFELAPHAAESPPQEETLPPKHLSSAPQ